MADASIAVTPGSGANVDTRTVTGGDHQQVVALGNGVDANTVGVTSAGDLQVYMKDLTASGTITTQNLVPAGTATANSAVLSGALNGRAVTTFQVTGTYTGALSVQGTVDGTTWVTLGGVPLLNVNTGVVSATVPSATQSIYQVNTSGYNQIRVTALAAVTGTATVTIRAADAVASVNLGAPVPTGANVIGALTANQSVNVAQMNGVATSMGNGVSGTGVLRVTVASDSTGVIAPAIPTQSFVNNAATTNATSTKGSAGTVYGIIVANASAETRYLKVYNKATAPTVGTDIPVLTFPVASGATLIVPCGELGIRLGTGIGWALLGSAGAADSATTACSTASDTKVSISYL